MSILDTNLQALPSSSHVQSDGSNIGGVDPSHYGPFMIPGVEQELLLYTVGNTGNPSTDYPAWMWYPTSPRLVIPTTPVNLALSFDYTITGNLSGFNVIETDTRMSFGGKDYNASAQFNQTTNQFQVVNSSDVWVNFGFSPGVMVANVKRRVKFEYIFDTVGHTVNVAAITCNGTRVTGSLTNPATVLTPSPWPTGLYLQLQLGSNPSAQQWQIRFANIQFEWS